MARIPQHKPDALKSAADIHGPWKVDGAETGLIERARLAWTTPISQLTNQQLAMFLRQRLAIRIAAFEAKRRLDAGFVDDTELYDGELENAFRDAESGDSPT